MCIKEDMVVGPVGARAYESKDGGLIRFGEHREMKWINTYSEVNV